MTDRLTLQALRAANEARQREWDKDDRIGLLWRANELAGETGEVCNAVKKLERERLGIRGSRDTLDHLAEELADVVICADLAAMTAGIDLGAAVVRKFNATSEKVGLATRLTDEAARREAEADAPPPPAPDLADWSKLPVKQPHEVTVSDAEVKAFRTHIVERSFDNGEPDEAHINTITKAALAAFLAKRVPDALATNTGSSVNLEIGAAFHNACRDAVLKGPQV